MIRMFYLWITVSYDEDILLTCEGEYLSHIVLWNIFFFFYLYVVFVFFYFCDLDFSITMNTMFQDNYDEWDVFF